MHLEPQAVAERMPERLPQTAGGDRLPRQGVGVPPAHPGAHAATRPPLRLVHDPVQRALALAGPRSHDHRARDIRAVTVHLSPEV